MRGLTFLLLVYGSILNAECPFSGWEPETEVSSSSNSNHSAQYPSPNSNSYYSYYFMQSGPIDEKLKTFIFQTSFLTETEKNNITFSIKGSGCPLQSSAYIHVPHISFGSLLHTYGTQGLEGNPISWTEDICLDPQYTLEVKIPPQLALRIFLSILLHELTHIRRAHRYLNPHIHFKMTQAEKTAFYVSEEWEADNGITDPYLGAAFVYFKMEDIISCYIYDTYLIKKFVEHKNIPTDYMLKTRYNIFKNHASDLHKYLHPHDKHPDHNARAEKVRNRAQQAYGKKYPFAECAEITIYSKQRGFTRTAIQKITICESFQEFMSSWPHWNKKI